MSPLISRLAREAFRRLAADPRVRAKAAEVGKVVADEARTVVREKDRAYAAGRSVRRAMKRLKGEG